MDKIEVIYADGEQQDSVENMLKYVLSNNSFSNGYMESLEDRISKMQDIFSRLIMVLINNKVISASDFERILGNSEYTNLRFKTDMPAAPKITYLIGDATCCDNQDNQIMIIPHICNDAGKWGRGFVMALSSRWKEPEKAYREYCCRTDFQLGDVQFVQVEEDLWVANMIAQKGIHPDSDGNPPIRYTALRDALTKVAAWAKDTGVVSVHMPRIGAGLAGGDWTKIEYIIDETLIREGIPVTVYDLPENK